MMSPDAAPSSLNKMHSLNHQQINHSGLTTPSNGHQSRGLQSYIQSQPQKQVVTPPTTIERRTYSRVYSPAQNHPYVEWLNRKNNLIDGDGEVTPHQANMIQKYSAMGQQAQPQDRFYISPRAGYATPFSPPNL